MKPFASTQISNVICGEGRLLNPARADVPVMVVGFGRAALDHSRRGGGVDKFECAVFGVDRRHDTDVSNMGLGPRSSREEHEVAGLHGVVVHRFALKILRTRVGVEVDAELAEHIAGESGTVKSFRSLAASTVAGA